MTMSASCARRSVIFPLPSSPHWAPTTAVTGTWTNGRRSTRAGQDDRAELRELEKRLRSHRLVLPPEERVPLRIARGVVVQRDPAGRERTRERDRRAPLMPGARDEDGGLDLPVGQEPCDRGYRRSAGGRRGGPPRLEALRAVHRTIRARREGDLRLLPAVRAHDVVHVRGARRAAFGLGLLTAIGTALRLVDETLLLIELLLARAPPEGV